MTFGYFSSQKSNAPPAGVQIRTFCKTCPADRRVEIVIETRFAGDGARDCDWPRTRPRRRRA